MACAIPSFHPISRISSLPSASKRVFLKNPCIYAASSSISPPTTFHLCTFPAASSFENHKGLEICKGRSNLLITGVLPRKKPDKERLRGLPKRVFLSPRRKRRLKNRMGKLHTTWTAASARRGRRARRRECRQKRPKKDQLVKLKLVYEETKRPSNAMIEGIGRFARMNRRLVVKWFREKRKEEGLSHRQPTIPFDKVPMENRLTTLPVRTRQIISSEESNWRERFKLDISTTTPTFGAKLGFGS